jgi:putative nucleotidyltransferase with HDIG domain
MADAHDRTQLYDDLIRRLASTLRGSLLYAPGHPLVARNLDALLHTLGQIHAAGGTVTIGVVNEQIVVADTPLPKTSASMGDLIRRLQVNGIERIVIDRGVTADELDTFARAVASLPAKVDPGAAPADPARGLAHVRVGRIVDEEKADGIQSDIEAIRQLYGKATAAAETLVQVTEREGRPDPGLAMQTVEGLADAVTQNRTALIALTAMKTYDNYTFTHMVNTSILTMGQARAIGIEGRLLREFGLSALMHDIGKVRTPQEILNKTGKLTPDEFEIMKRHTVDGAEILRRTPEMPILSPVVAFEHHLRLDGTGYPAGARRSTLNLGTQLCSIADVYDAMRSNRSYQKSHPSDRVLAVLKENDGAHFDKHLVRRFSQLLGVYPPGNLVRLSSGELAVVIKVHAPDPYRPRVRIIVDTAGERMSLPIDRNLWESRDDDGQQSSIATPVDPAEHGIDPLTFLA